jgi:hypothetical protein
VAGRPSKKQEKGGREVASTTDTASLLDWTIRYAVPASGLAAAVIYGVLRLSYALFYQPLRATPEEVGYGYSEILAGQLIGALELTLVVWGVCFGIAWLWRAARRRLGPPVGKARPPRNDEKGRPALWGPAARSALVALGLVAVLLPVIAREMGAIAATNGETMRNIHLVGSNIPVLPVTAVPARVTALNPEAGDIEGRACLLYLGAAAGVFVFFDVRTKEGLRVPSTAVVVHLFNSEGVDTTCADGVEPVPTG